LIVALTVLPPWLQVTVPWIRPPDMEKFSWRQPAPSFPVKNPALGRRACSGVRQERTVTGACLGMATPCGMFGMSMRITSTVVSHWPGRSSAVATDALPLSGAAPDAFSPGAAPFSAPAAALPAFSPPPHEASSNAAPAAEIICLIELSL
jgi:hypothetical protein